MAAAPGAAEDQAKRDLDLQQHLTTGEKNPRGIPVVVFIVRARVCYTGRSIDRIEGRAGRWSHAARFAYDHAHAWAQDDVEAFLQQKLGGVAAETAIGAFNELYSYVAVGGRS